MLRITQVTIKDVLGAREVGIEAGEITVISGENGTGKTSVLEAVKTAIGGGKLANLARIDDTEETKPEVVLVLDGDEGHFRIEKDGTKVRVRERVGDTQGFKDVQSPQRWLSGLYDGALANPIDFLNANDKRRVLLLLEALPIELDRKQLWEEMGLEPTLYPPVPSTLHPLQEIGMIRENVFRERTGVNVDRKGKESAAEQTRRETPAELPADQEAKITALMDKINDETESVVRREGAAAEKRDKARWRHRIDLTAQTGKVDREGESFASELRAETERRISARLADDTILIENFTNDYDRKNTEVSNAYDDEMTEFNEAQSAIDGDKLRLSELRHQQREATMARTLARKAEDFQTQADELSAESERLTAALDALDLFRRRLADDLPIKGLEVGDKTIKHNGIPWSQLNTALQIELAVKISCLRARGKRLPVVWVDGAERLDSDNFEILCASLHEENVQAFIGKVGDEPLTWETK